MTSRTISCRIKEISDLGAGKKAFVAVVKLTAFDEFVEIDVIPSGV